MLVHNQHLRKSLVIDIEFYLWKMQIAISLTEVALVICFTNGEEKLLPWTGIKPTSLDLSSYSWVSFLRFQMLKQNI